MRAADRVDDGTAHEVGVVGGEKEVAGREVGWVVGISEERGGEEGGDVGVVHYIRGAVAVDFVSVDVVAADGGDAVGLDCGADGGG